MKIFIGSDHGGYNLKSAIINFLQENNYDFEDVGTFSDASCDYPPIAEKVAQNVIKNSSKGILVCGTGIGMSIAANKFKGIRAALCSDTFSARLTREHNDSNILCLGERTIGTGLALDIVKIWLETDFSNNDRHINRINLIKQIEERI